METNILNIKELVQRGRKYYDMQDNINDTETEVSYNTHVSKIQVASIVYFKTFDDEGEPMWENDVSGIDSYTPREFNIHLDTVEQE